MFVLAQGLSGGRSSVEQSTTISSVRATFIRQNIYVVYLQAHFDAIATEIQPREVRTKGTQET